MLKGFSATVAPGEFVYLLGRVGSEDEIAQAVFYLFTNTYTTGSTLYPDGGYALR